MIASDVKKALEELASPQKAKASAWFFKTGKGQYGKGDEFIGVTVPEQRRVAKHFRDLPLQELEILLASPVHEHRLTALFILVSQYERAVSNITPGSTLRVEPRKIVNFYLKYRNYVNNWDLVDSSAPQILGAWLVARRGLLGGVGRDSSEVKEARILYDLVHSKSLWDRRIAIVATQAFIKAGQFDETLRIAEQLLGDTEDLIHKATGWMLREIGNRDAAVLRRFLDTHAATMPRTMLRYAIEKLPPTDRKHYLGLKRDAT